MRPNVTRSFSFAFLFAAIAATGCAVDVDDAASGDEMDLTASKLPPASAAPLLDAEELAFLKAANGMRKAKKLPPLRLAVGLVKAAKKHSKEMADLNAVDATHNDGGKGDTGALREKAIVAARNRIDAEYEVGDCANGDTPCGESWGEDCARRDDIGPGQAAFDLFKTKVVDLKKPGFGELGFPTGEETVPPNLVTEWWSAVGISRAKSSKGVWYWTITYGTSDGDFEPMLAADGSVEHSLLSNGSFEAPAKDDFDEPSVGSATFGATRAIRKWHLFANNGGTATIQANNSFFLDDVQTTKAHGLHLVDSSTGSASATQLVKAVPGVNYELSVRARRIGAATGGQTAFLDFIDGSFQRIGVTTVAGGTQPAWSADPLKVSATAPAGTKFVRVILFGTGEAGKGSTYDWDDVRLRAW